jgi:hypothetical protein
MATAAEFISVLHQSKTQAQVWHHQTTSYSEHKALGKYYEGITELIDGLVESLQGYVPRITGYTTKLLVDWKEGLSLEYLKSLCEYVQAERLSVGDTTWIQNQIDEIQKLLYTTKYKLTLK